jgi:alpha-1,2-glucosyltransferase
MQSAQSNASKQQRFLPALWFLVVVVVTLSIAVQLKFRGMSLWLDEGSHYEQIDWLFHHKFRHSPSLTTFETYHWVVTALSTVVYRHSFHVEHVRYVSAVISIAYVFAAFACTAKLHGSASVALTRSMQLLLLPIMTVYAFLLYTDGFALGALLLAVAFSVWRRYVLAAAFGILCVGIRQTNVYWLLWLAALYVVQEGVWQDMIGSPPGKRWAVARSHLVRLSPYLAGMLGFAVFVIVNRGVALGDRSHHPSFKFGMGNVFAFFVLAACALLPLHVAEWRAVVRLLRQYPKRCGFGVLLFSAWFVFGFKADHPYNDLGGFLHNDAIAWLRVPWHRALVVLPAAWGALSMLAAIEDRRHAWVLAGATLLSLLPVWMIEHRYYIVPIALWLCFRKQRSWLAETATVVWFAGWSFAAVNVVRNGPSLL